MGRGAKGAQVEGGGGLELHQIFLDMAVLVEAQVGGQGGDEPNGGRGIYPRCRQGGRHVHIQSTRPQPLSSFRRGRCWTISRSRWSAAWATSRAARRRWWMRRNCRRTRERCARAAPPACVMSRYRSACMAEGAEQVHSRSTSACIPCGAAGYSGHVPPSLAVVHLMHLHHPALILHPSPRLSPCLP